MPSSERSTSTTRLWPLTFGGVSARARIRPQALVERGGGNEPAQETDLSRHFPRCVAPLRNDRRRRFDNRFGDDLWGVARFHRFSHDHIHASARGVINAERSVWSGEVFFEGRP